MIITITSVVVRDINARRGQPVHQYIQVGGVNLYISTKIYDGSTVHTGSRGQPVHQYKRYEGSTVHTGSRGQPYTGKLVHTGRRGQPVHQ